MSIGYGMQMEQTQKLIMTPELRQAIWLLQLSSTDLMTEVEKQLEENPVLELNEEAPAESDSDKDTAEQSNSDSVADDNETDFDWQKYISENTNSEDEHGFYEVKEKIPIENWVTGEQSLCEYLIWQLHMAVSDHRTNAIGQFLIGNIDDNGYLKVSVEDGASYFSTSVQEIEDVLKIIHSFDPVGVGARDLRECLAIQLDAVDCRDEIVRQLVESHLQNIADGKYTRMADILGASLHAVQEAVDFITTLDPKPGRQYASCNDIRYLVPDVFVERVGNDFIVMLNDTVAPMLTVSRYYQDIVKQRAADGEAMKFIEHRMNSALWFIRSIEQRRQTINKVTESIVRFQRSFFERGVRHLKPLTLKQVAADIGMHESTVSRATCNKYVQTPHGLYELSFFFSSGLDDLGGDGISSESVKAMILDLIAAEDTHKPLSDQKIADMLGQRGIEISRRTVAKYREEKQISPSARRKRY